MSTEIALTADIYKILDEFHRQYDALETLIPEATKAATEAENSAAFRGTYSGQSLYWGSQRRPDMDLKMFRECLTKSAWRYLYGVLKIESIAPETCRRGFSEFFNDPVEFTADNIKQVFKDYVNAEDRRALFLKSFADIFTRLDNSYKSHDPFKVGVKGLPKRIIIGGCTEYGYSGWERVADTVNVINKAGARTRGKMSRYDIQKLATGDAPYYHGLAFKHFKNGNTHIIFDDGTLNMINSILAEYYGEVLPDAAEKPTKKRTSTAVSKDLQFYRTPEAAADSVIRSAQIREGDLILEPSCGDGALLDAIRRNSVKCSAVAVEYDAARAQLCRDKGYAVTTGNFLEFITEKRFDKIIMNPPFYGKHYEKHVRHAYSMLKEGGTLCAVLPATAAYTHNLLDDLNPRWQDLPCGSFKASGTGINTVILTLYKRK